MCSLKVVFQALLMTLYTHLQYVYVCFIIITIIFHPPELSRSILKSFSQQRRPLEKFPFAVIEGGAPQFWG